MGKERIHQREDNGDHPAFPDSSALRICSILFAQGSSELHDHSTLAARDDKGAFSQWREWSEHMDQSHKPASDRQALLVSSIGLCGIGPVDLERHGCNCQDVGSEIGWGQPRNCTYPRQILHVGPSGESEHSTARPRAV